MGGLSPSSKWTALLAGFLIAGTGVGFVNAPLSFTAVSVVEQRLSGTAAGINNTFRQVGIATGIAGLGAIFQTRVTDGLHSALAGTSVRPGDVDRLGQAVVSGGARQAIESAPAGAHDAVVEAANRAFIDGINDLFIIAALVAFAGAAAALVLVRSSDLLAEGPPEAAPSPAAEQSTA
jgi:hypothetical protein